MSNYKAQKWFNTIYKATIHEVEKLYWLPEVVLPPYNGIYGEAPPERGTFFRRKVCERIGISLVEVYETVAKSFISICKMT